MEPSAQVRGPGALLRGYRERALLTQEQLAERTGMSERTIRRLESGAVRRPRAHSLRVLADALGLSDAERAALASSGVEAGGAGAEKAVPPSPSTPASPQPRRPGIPVPRHLPGGAAFFVGRVSHLRRLDALLDASLTERMRPVPTVVISAIGGTAGIGKTALALYWARRAADRFPDGQLYVNLRGFDPGGTPMSVAAALQVLLTAVGVPPHSVPAGEEAQAGLYRSLLADRRMLVILDNARDAEQVRPLLPGPSGCMVVVTSRSRLAGLVAAEGAHPLTLDLLTAADAQELLAARLGRHRTEAEPAAVEEIVVRCAGLPLALAVVSARAANHPRFPLAGLAAELRETRDGLNSFALDDVATDVRAVFSWSYRRLSPAAGALFRLLGLHPGPDVTVPAASALAGVGAEQVRRALAELAGAQLVEEHATGRYTFHDLLRAYAAELVETLDTAEDRHRARQRSIDHYLHTAAAADRLLHPDRDTLEIAPTVPGTEPEHLADRDAALDWLGAERPVLLATVEQAAASGFGTQSWQLAWTLWEFLNRRGHWDEWATAQQTALDAATELDDRPGQAHSRRGLARACTALGRYPDAHAHLDRALELFAALGDATGQAHTHNNLAHVLGLQGRQEEAVDHTRRAFELYQVAGHRGGQADTLSNLGWFLTQLGDHERALTYCRRALALFVELGSAHTTAEALDSLGLAHHNLGQYEEAVASYEAAIAQYIELEDRYNEAVTLARIGDSRRAAGQVHAARTAWQRSVEILDELQHADAGEVRAKLDAHPVAGDPAPVA